MKKHIIAAITLCLISTSSQIARAYPTVPDAVPFMMPLTLTSESTLDLHLSTLDGVGTDQLSFDLTGSINIGLDSSNVINLSSISIEDAAIDLSDETLLFSLGFLGQISGAMTGLGIHSLGSNIDIPLIPIYPGYSTAYTFTPSGPPPLEGLIDEGQFTYLGTGPVAGMLGSGTLDFSLEPIPGIIESQGFLSLTPAGALSSSVFIEVIVSIPITFSDATMPLDGISTSLPLEVSGSGVLVATGTYAVIAEPSTFVLLGMALVALIPLRQRFVDK